MFELHVYLIYFYLEEGELTLPLINQFITSLQRWRCFDNFDSSWIVFADTDGVTSACCDVILSKILALSQKMDLCTLSGFEM